MPGDPLFLKNLKIYGFKTFGRKVTIDFQKGITAIVGPNGAGKSNLIEALNWVIGETKLSNIRVKTQDQLIFHGSPALRPLALAEVSLTIENSEGRLPIDYTEVNITRRVSKDGTGEYLLNKNRCNLKDITNLFMGTGVGRSAYSVMRQGEIDQLVQRKPEERREIFEEAAGILKFRHRRQETERELERIEANLKQTLPTLTEVDRQLKAKEKQAERAEEYRKLRDRQFGIETDLNLYKLFQLKKDLAHRREQLAGVVEKRTAAFKAQENLEKEIDNSIKERQNLQISQHEVQSEILRHEGHLNGMKQRISMLEEKLQEQRDAIENSKRSLEQTTEKAGRIDRDIAGLELEKTNLARMIEEQLEALERYDKDIAAVKQIINDSTESIHRHEKRIVEVGELLFEARSELEKVIDNLVTAIDRRKAELKGSTELKREIRENINLSLEEITLFLRSKKDVLDDMFRSGHVERADKGKLGETLEGFARGLDEKLQTVERLKEQFTNLDNILSGFDEIIFAREGIHAHKEKLDQKISELDREERSNKERILFLETDINNQQQRLETIKQMMHDTQIGLAQMREKLNSVENAVTTQEAFREDLHRQKARFQSQIQAAEESIARIREQLENTVRELEESTRAREGLQGELKGISEKLSSITDISSTREEKARRVKEEIESLHDRYEQVNMDLTRIEVEVKNVYDNFLTNFSADLSEYEGNMVNKTFDVAQLKEALRVSKEEIRLLGQINPMAIEEREELKERHTLLKEQIEDIQKARKNLLEIILEINRNSEEIFHETFNKINVNFHKLFRRLFNGGKAELVLTDPANILESGIEILVQPPSKALQSVALLSGGENSMTAIALLFAIFMVKPSPFCLLDEIDAALDLPNIERFKKLINEFRGTTQFLMISHNINTLKVADAIYGISMEEAGVTTAISLDLNELEKNRKKYFDKKNVDKAE